MTTRAVSQFVVLGFFLLTVLGGCITVQCTDCTKSCDEGSGGVCGTPPIVNQDNTTLATDGTACTNDAGHYCPNTNTICGPNGMKCTTVNSNGMCGCSCKLRP